MNASLKHNRKENSPVGNNTSPGLRAPVSISGIGLCCQAGAEPFALFGAVAAHFTGARSHPDIDGQLPGEDATAPVQYVPLADLEGLDTPHERIAAMAEMALIAAANQLPGDIDSAAVLVVTLTPPEETPRSANLDIPALQKELAACHPGVLSACFRFVPHGQGAVEMLQQACAELEAGKWEAILFGGADSMVDTVTLSETARSGEAMVRGGAGGVLPGEGAAYLVLERESSTRTLASIEALSFAPEPHHGDAHEKKMTGLARAIRCVIQDADAAPDRLDSIVLPFGCTTPESLEWHQVLEDVWSRREKIPRTFEVLIPAGTLGITGAAALPVNLALGCARFDFDFVPAQKLLVCEAGNGPSRGAVFLKKASSQ